MQGRRGSSKQGRAEDGGDVTVHGDVAGAGDATISGTATLEFDGASAENTTFADGGDGTLRLDHSSSFTGAVSGFNHGDSLDLGDVAFDSGTGTTLSYAANDAGNVYVGTDLKSVP